MSSRWFGCSFFVIIWVNCYVIALLFGATRKNKEAAFDSLSKQYDIYKERVRDKFKESEFEDYVNKKLEEFDSEIEAANIINSSSDEISSQVSKGMDTFSIEDLVTAAETLVNAEVRFKHLFSKGKDAVRSTKEIAVITQTEGVTWLKHSLFAL